MIHFLVQIIRMILEHAGLGMDSTFWTDKPYGSSRSIVRRIATSLPLKPCPRVQLQLHPYPEEADSSNQTSNENGIVASLADVAWIDEYEGESFTRLRSNVCPGYILPSPQVHRLGKPLTRQVSLPNITREELEPKTPVIANDEAIQKISALENELAQLREQIARIVIAQEQNALISAGSLTPLAAPPVPPPPPPPPPPPGLHRSVSAMDLIKERRGKKNSSDSVLLDSGPKQSEIPNMLDILKDMTKVKLRTVKKPMEGTSKTKPGDPTDAAALIAAALKRKFAHRYRNDSENEKEMKIPTSECNTAAETEIPFFGQHMLKSTGKRKVLVSSTSKP
ncbi:MTFR1 regulator, partial [Polyodon spathula]|nr:MTFR1 regulator [Polyodon spathula]